MVTQRVRGKKAKFLGLPRDKFGNFRVLCDGNGQPDYGHVLRFYRKVVHGWSAEHLAIAYSEALSIEAAAEGWKDEGQEITARWIQLMEQKNRVPQDPKRRWVLATLLSIPPALFGLEPLTFSTNEDRHNLTSTIATNVNIDVAEYSCSLNSSWEQHFAKGAFNLVPDIENRIEKIYYSFLYTSPSQKNHLLRLLSGYHILLGEIARDRGYYDSAIVTLNKAIAIAKEHDFHSLHAAALHLRGNVYLNKWETDGKKDNRANLTHALHNYNAASQLNTHLSPQLNGAIAVLRGLVYANMADTHEDKNKALKLMDIGGNIARQAFVEENDFVMIKLNELMYHNEKGSALIAVGWPVEALRELFLADEQTNLTLQRRRVYNTILQVSAYTKQGLYPIATTLARDTLTEVKHIKSGLNLARITNIYSNLKESSYGSSVNVAQLGVELMKARQPQMFQ